MKYLVDACHSRQQGWIIFEVVQPLLEMFHRGQGLVQATVTLPQEGVGLHHAEALKRREELLLSLTDHSQTIIAFAQLVRPVPVVFLVHTAPLGNHRNLLRGFHVRLMHEHVVEQMPVHSLVPRVFVNIQPGQIQEGPIPLRDH